MLRVASSSVLQSALAPGAHRRRAGQRKSDVVVTRASPRREVTVCKAQQPATGAIGAVLAATLLVWTARGTLDFPSVGVLRTGRCARRISHPPTADVCVME